MDAEHRHELKQNDLEEFLTHFKDFWAKWGNGITIALLVIVLAFTGYRLWSVRQDTARQTALTELATAETPKALMSLARDASDPVVSTLAYLRAADRLVHDLAMPDTSAGAKEAPPRDSDRSSGATGPKAVDPAERARLLDEAAAAYQQAIKQAPHPVFAYNARLGLATVLEFQGQWDKASEVYAALARDAAETHPGIAGQARVRQQMLARVQVPVVFAPEPQPTPGNEAQSASGEGTDPAPNAQDNAPAANDSDSSSAPAEEPGDASVVTEP